MIMGKIGKKKMMNGGMIKLKIVVERLQKMSVVYLGKKHSSSLDDSMVKEGHFAVIAEEEDEMKRFVVPLSYLSHPSFMRLLEQAADEYGFDHDGALTVPCRPTELERILAESPAPSRVDNNYWCPCNKTTLKTY